MAEVHDLDVEASELDVVEEQIEEQAAQKQVEDEMPEEFRGKTAADLVGMLKHTRRELGKQNAEVGEIRKLADELIKSQLRPKQPEPVPVQEVDFFENPQEAIRQAVDNNPKVRAAEQYTAQIHRERSLHHLNQLHPDFPQILQDGEFQNWVKSNRIRTQLFQQAEGYDVEAADQLFQAFKLTKQAVAPRVEVSDAEKSARTKALQSASVDTGGSGESGKKVYRRTDLIRLKMRDPAKYESMSDEIMAAYSQGRVK